MPRINLLPWRDALRRRRAQRFLIAAAAALFTAAGMLLTGHLYLDDRIAGQMQRNRRIQQAIDHLQGDLRRHAALAQRESELLSRLAVIDNLQSSRGLATRLFESLARATPATIQLTRVAQQDGQLRIQGLADSSHAVSDYMRRLDASGQFTTAKLLTLNTLSDSQQRRHPFSLSVGQAIGNLGRNPEIKRATP